VRDALTNRESVTGPISISVGAAIYPIDGASSEELINAANAALKEAKRRGRGSIFVASGA
jgi:GGDEF domain-containing protein